MVFEDSPVTNDPISDLNLFDAVNRLPSLKLLDLSGTQLKAIPDEAFVPILDWLNSQTRHLLFCKQTQRCRSIRSVGKKAFYYLVSLQIIDLSSHLIDFIDDNAFSIHEMNNTGNKLQIILNDNHLNGESFTEDSFKYIGRPTLLSLSDNKNLTYIRQEVFEPFLEDNHQNHLNISGCPIDLNSPQNQWLKNLKKGFKNRIYFH